MSVFIIFAILGAPLVAIAIGHYVDKLRGVETESELVDSLLIANERLSPDDAPRWAEGIAFVLAIGLTIRSACHLGAAAAAGKRLHVTDHDATLGNVVVAIRDGDWRPDLAGRFIAMLFGLVVWTALQPLTLMWPGPAWVTPLGRLFVLSNVAVLLADPVAFAIYRLRTKTNITMKPNRTQTDRTDTGRTDASGGD